MTVIINASPSNGLTQTADGSGLIKIQSNGVTTNALAWVNFNGSTAAIRSAYNVGSITKNGTGDYTLNFTNALSDANYVAVQSTGDGSTSGRFAFAYNAVPTTTTYRCSTTTFAGTNTDFTYTAVAVFGN